MKRFLLFFMAIMFFVMQGWTQTPVTLPYSQNFEDTTSISEWTFTSSNSTTTDMWVIGAATGNTGNSMYISSDGGVTNSYSQFSTYTYASVLVDFGQAAEFSLSFDWKGMGESGYDKFSVYAIPLSASMPTSGYPGGGVTLLSPTGQQSTWQNVNIILPSATFANTTQRLIFVWYSDGSTIINPPVAVDNIRITSSNCVTPTGLAASNITQTSASLAWTEVGTATAWYLYYKEATATNYDSVHVTTNPYILQNLTVNTPYNAYIKADCGSEYSNSSPVVNFRTTCYAITTLPWTENFDTYGTGTTIYPACWYRINTYSSTMPYIRSTNNYSAPGSLYFYTATSGTYNMAILPPFNASIPVDTLMLQFYYRNSNATDRLNIGVMTNPADATTFDSITTIQASSTSTWQFFEVNLNSYTGTGQYIAFKNAYTTTGAYAYIDDLTIDAIPACPNTYNLTSTLRSATEVDLNWMQNGNGSGWVIAYDNASTFGTLSSPTITITSTENIPYTFTGLNPQTTYSFAVRQNCANGAWSNIVSITTPATAATLPYSHDFEDVAENGAWTFINGTQTNQWVIGTAADTLGNTGLYISNDQGLTNAYIGGSIAASKVYAYRDFEVPTGAGELELSFYWRAMGGDATTDFLRIYLVPLDANITAGVIPPGGLDASAQIGNYTGGTGEHWLSQSTVWQHQTIRINSIQFPNLAGRTWRLLVHWRNESSTTTGIQPPAAVDNINLSVVACPLPSALAASNITTTSALLTWNENGLATNWIIEYKPTSSTTWMTYQTTSNPDSITGLMSGTNYNARIRSFCSTGDTSLYSNTITFQTVCAALTVPTPIESFLTAVPPTTCWSKMQGLLPATGTATLSSATEGWYWDSNVTPHNAKLPISYANCNYWLISPSVNLGNDTIPAQIEFDVFYTDRYSTNSASTGGTDDKFAVVVSTDDGLTWDAANATIWSNATGTTRVLDNITHIPTHIILPLFDPATTLPYTGTIKIGFYGESTVSNANNGIHIDNFEIRPYSTCQRPSSVSVTVATTDASVNFTENGSSTTWEYVYGEATTITDPTTGTAVSTTTNPIQLTGLTPQTQYNIWVRSVCGSSNSDWSNLCSFVTESLPATLPYACDFENTTESLGWRSLSSSVNKWTIGIAAGNGNTTAGTQANYISKDNGISYAMNYGYIYAYTYRDIDFGTNAASYNLSFDWKCQGYFGSWNNTLYAGLRVYLREPSESISTSDLPTNPNDNLGTFYNYSTWQNAQIPIDNVSGVKRLIFVYFDQFMNFDPPAAIDNISLVQLACPRPANVIASNLTTTTAEISWVHPGAVGYIVSYKAVSDSTYTEATTSTSPYNIQGLTLGTQYIVSVRAICSGDTTNYSANMIFKTPCVDGAVSIYPYIEDFTSGIDCWLSISSGTSASGFWQSSTSGNNPTTTPHSSPNMLYFNSQNTQETGYLISSEFDIPASTPLAVHFWMVRNENFSSYNEFVEILVNTTQSITGATSLGLVHRNLGMSPIETVAGWHEYSFTVPDSITGPRYFFIKGQGAGSNNMYVDDFSIILLGCPIPQGVTATDITTAAADISWTGTDDATAWNIEYKSASDTTWTIVAITTNPYTITGLSAGTSYSVKVQTDCGTNGLSNYGFSTFITPCANEAISSFPWTEGFENGISCWQQIYVNGTLSWTNPSVYNPNSPTQPYEGSKIVLFEGDAKTNITKLVSPLINISSLSTPYLSYWYILQNWGVTDRDTLRVYSRPSQTSSWTLLSTFYALDTYAWKKDSIALPNPSATYQIAFEGIERYGHGVGLDEITVYDSEPCIAPTNLIVSNIPQTATYNASWDLGGSENSWQVRIGTNGTSIDVTSQSYLITGLIPDSNYTVYVRANCGTSYSPWISQSFTNHQFPIVTTNTVTGLTQTTATLNGSYVQGTDSILTKGFEWKLASASTWNRDTVIAGTTPFSLPLNNLTANTHYHVKAFVVTATEGITYGDSLQFATDTPPTVTTTAVTNITQNTATFNGNYSSGTETIQARGFEYKLTTTATWTGAVDITASGTTTISANATGLTPSTQYDVRAYAQTASGRTYGNIENFTTLSLDVVLGEVTTQSVTNIDTTHAVLNGNLVSVGNAISNIEVGFVYSTVSNPILGETSAVRIDVPYVEGMTAYSSPIEELQHSTTYYVKAFINNSAGDAYGDEVTFITDSLPSGLRDIEADQFSVSIYPNPATNTTKLVVSGVEGETDIAINDIQGKLIYKTTAKAVNGKVEQTIDVNNFVRGVYYIRIQNQTTSRTQKLIVIY